MGDALRIKETPTNQLYQQFEEAGTDLAQVRGPGWCTSTRQVFAASLLVTCYAVLCCESHIALRLCLPTLPCNFALQRRLATLPCTWGHQSHVLVHRAWLSTTSVSSSHGPTERPCVCVLASLLQALTTKDKIAHMKAAMPANVAKAMGRLSSGLYIVTAQQENARRCGQAANSARRA